MILLGLPPTFFFFFKYIDFLCLTKIQGLIWWWFHLVIIGCYTIVFALPCNTGLKKEKKSNLGTWGKYSLRWLQIAIYLPVRSLFWLLILSHAWLHKSQNRGIKRSFRICIWYVVSSVTIWNTKAQGLKYEPAFCFFAFRLSILSMCFFHCCWNGDFIIEGDCGVCVGGDTKIIIKSNTMQQTKMVI